MVEALEGPAQVFSPAAGEYMRKLRCPDCGNRAIMALSVNGHVLTEPGDTGAYRLERLDFDGSSQCECTACGYTQTARHFSSGLRGYYTVVLLYPDYATGDYGADIYVDSAIAESPFEAASAVQEKASLANNSDIPEADFRPVAVFSGDVTMELCALDF